MEVASLSAFQRRPEAFYEWVRPLAHRIHLAHPNPAHLALADLETRGLIKAIITQNIDNLHQKAGSRTVYEIHGTLREATCLRCFAQTPLSSYLDAYLRNGDIPHCPSCGGILKPNVVLFGEMLPPHTFWQAQESIRSCDVLLVVGSSLEVAPASDLPKLALRHGAHLIIVNRGTTAFDHAADVLIHEDAALILPRLAELISLTA
jgi:NAD-dependent deacetylase